MQPSLAMGVCKVLGINKKTSDIAITSSKSKMMIKAL